MSKIYDTSDAAIAERMAETSRKYFDFGQYTRDQAFELCGDVELVGRIVETVSDGGVFPDLVEGPDGLLSELSDVTKQRLRNWLISFWSDMYADRADVEQCADICFPILRAAISFSVNANLVLARSVELVRTEVKQKERKGTNQ